MVTSAPDSLAVQGEQRAWILGWSNDARTRLAVARTNDGGLSWHTSALPCRSPETLSGLLAVSGNSLLALCQGEVHTGAMARWRSSHRATAGRPGQGVATTVRPAYCPKLARVQMLATPSK